MADHRVVMRTVMPPLAFELHPKMSQKTAMTYAQTNGTNKTNSAMALSSYRSYSFMVFHLKEDAPAH